MNMRCGEGLQQKMDTTAPLPEQPSNGSLQKSIKPEEKSSLVPLAQIVGAQSNTKELATKNLIQVAEGLSSAELSIESKKLIAQFVDQSTNGYASSMTMICRGHKCPFISCCPLKAAGSKLPEGKRCPVEDTLTAVWVTKHLKFLGIEDIHDPSHSFDMDMLYELAGQELLRWRCSVHLSDTPGLVSREQVGGTVSGEAIFADIINPVLEIMEKAGRNVAKIREALVATRKAQMEAGHDLQDPTQKAALLREKAQQLATRRSRESIKDAEFKISDEQS